MSKQERYLQEAYNLDATNGVGPGGIYVGTILYLHRDILTPMVGENGSLRDVPDEVLLAMHQLGPTRLAMIRKAYPYRGASTPV